MNVRILTLIGLLFVLSACGMPSSIATLSYVMNGVSYASSGKGVADHALSVAADKDCAMLRVAEGADICESNAKGNGGTLMTMMESAPNAGAMVATFPQKQQNSEPMPVTGSSAKRTSENEGSRPMVAAESIYGQAR